MHSGKRSRAIRLVPTINAKPNTKTVHHPTKHTNKTKANVQKPEEFDDDTEGSAYDAEEDREEELEDEMLEEEDLDLELEEVDIPPKQPKKQQQQQQQQKQQIKPQPTQKSLPQGLTFEQQIQLLQLQKEIADKEIEKLKLQQQLGVVSTAYANATGTPAQKFPPSTTGKDSSSTNVKLNPWFKPYYYEAVDVSIVVCHFQ